MLPDPNPLFPSPAERERMDALLGAALARAEAQIGEKPVTPGLSRTELVHELATFDFVRPRPLEELMSWIIERLEHGVTRVTHPRYFGLFNPAPTYPAQCADRIAASFNPQLATATTSPFAVALEDYLIRAVAARVGLPQESRGHFTTGGSEANATALIAALTKAHPNFARAGARCFAAQPALYISREAHLAWIKIAHQTGIGRDAVHLIATDGMGRMRVDALAAAIEEDLNAGRVPVLVVATAGTTGAGMIDPIDAIGDLTRHHGVWHHVDAAWAGAAIASDRLRPLLAGIAEADSVTIDAHKWFATTMGCGMFMTRHPATLSAAFEVATTYMPSNEAALDPYVTSIQWSRRFLGIRLFLSLAAAGWKGYAAHVERAVGIAARIGEELGRRGWRVVNRSPVAVLCLEPPAGSADPRTIAGRVQASGRAYVSVASFEGSEVVRACVTHGATSDEDIAILIGALEDARGR